MDNNDFNGLSMMKKAYCRKCGTDAEIHTITEIYPEFGIEKNQK